MAENGPAWKLYDRHGDAPVRMLSLCVDTDTEYAQRLLHDPLSVLLDEKDAGTPGFDVLDDGWRVQVVMTSAHLPTGPLPPRPAEERPDLKLCVIRHIMIPCMFLEELREVIMVLHRWGLDRTTALGKLAECHEEQPGDAAASAFVERAATRARGQGAARRDSRG